jgi:hypothetical protein
MLKKINILNNDRKRIKVSNKIKSQIEKDIINMPSSNINRKKIDEKYFFAHIPSNIKKPYLQYNLPIVEVDTKILKSWNKNNLLEVSDPTRYLNQSDFRTINRSCVGVDKDTNRILWVFVKGKDDPAIRYTLKHADDVVEGMDDYLKTKLKHFYSGFGDWKGSGKDDREKRYTGKNWLDGLQRFFAKFKNRTGENWVAYYKMKEKGQSDIDWRYKELRLYSLLYQLEKRYVPASAEYRYFLADRVNLPGIGPKLSLELNPSTSVGGSINFSSSFHRDSSVRGTTEAIIWTPAKTGKQIFVNGAGYYFNIDDYCVIFQVGTDYHGTAPTGEHGGLGFVNLTKKNLVANTEFMKDWYTAWNSL